MAINEGKALLIDGKFTGEKKTAKYLAEQLNIMIEHIGVNKVCGVVTDNAPANKCAWKILNRKFTSIYFYGCICHTLHLFVKEQKKKNSVLTGCKLF